MKLERGLCPNQRVKALDNTNVNRNVVGGEPADEILQNIIYPRVSAIGWHECRIHGKKVRWTML